MIIIDKEFCLFEHLIPFCRNNKMTINFVINFAVKMTTACYLGIVRNIFTSSFTNIKITQ